MSVFVDLRPICEKEGCNNKSADTYFCVYHGGKHILTETERNYIRSTEYDSLNKETKDKKRRLRVRKNKDKIAKYQKEWCEKNRAKHLATRKKYREKNKERIKRLRKRWLQKNPEKVRAINKDANKKRMKNYFKNRDIRIKTMKKYYYENKDKISEYNKKRYLEVVEPQRYVDKYGKEFAEVAYLTNRMSVALKKGEIDGKAEDKLKTFEKRLVGYVQRCEARSSGSR